MLSFWGVQDPPEDEELTASGRKRPRPRESFFNWFDPPGQGVPQNVDVDSTAEALKDDIWPNPLKFFSGDILLPEELEVRSSRALALVSTTLSIRMLSALGLLGRCLI